MRSIRIKLVTASLAIGVAAAQTQPPAPANPPAAPTREIAAPGRSASIAPAASPLPEGPEELLPPTPPSAGPPSFEFDFDDGDLLRMRTDIERMAAKAVIAAGAFPMFAQAASPPQPPQPPQPAVAPRPGFVYMDKDRPDRKDSEDRLYRRGAGYLDRRQYDKALEAFQEAMEAKGARADGAAYWKAYSLHKLGRRDEALATLAELRKSHAASRWLNDAKALEVEVKQAGGRGVSPERESDEELKLLAINSVMHNDPERALPLLEKILASQGEPRLKERALFVIAQSNSPRARETVAQVAKGGGNPDLQLKAVEYLGIHGGAENLKLLSSIYASADASVKRRILHSFMVARDKDSLMRAAKGEADAGLRREAIHLLGVTQAENELVQLYGGESSVEIRESILHALGIGNRPTRLIELARAEKDPKLRLAAVHRIGITKRSPAIAEALVAMYGAEQDKAMKQAIIHAIAMQGGGKALVDIARKETDPSLKREIVQRLSMAKSQEGVDYLLELLSK